MKLFDLKAIENRRRMLRISRKDMAQRLSLSNESVYWKYEKGDYKFKAETLPKLAAILQCEPQYFFTDQSSNLEQFE